MQACNKMVLEEKMSDSSFVCFESKMWSLISGQEWLIKEM